MSESAGDSEELAARRTRILAVALLLLNLLDISVVLTGLPEIRASFGLSELALSWVENACLLSFGASLLLGGRDAALSRDAMVAGVCDSTLSRLTLIHTAIQGETA